MSLREEPVTPPVFDTEEVWMRRYVRDYSKPVPMKWSRYYVESMKLEEEEGRVRGWKWVDESILVMGGSEGLSTLQEIILEGDTSTALYQIAKLEELEEGEDSGEEETITSKSTSSTKSTTNTNTSSSTVATNPSSSSSHHVPIYEREKSILHYAVLTGQEGLVEGLLSSTGFKGAVNQKDVLTGFTPLHFACFIQHPLLIHLLLSHGANIDILDYYGSSPVDYLRMLGIMPHPKSLSSSLLESPAPNTTTPFIKIAIPRSFSKEMMNDEELELSVVNPSQLESIVSLHSPHPFTWYPYNTITFDYIEELMFGGFQVPEVKDIAFRNEHFPKMIAESSLRSLQLLQNTDTNGPSQPQCDPSQSQHDVPWIGSSGGEEGVVVGYVGGHPGCKSVGWALFASKPFLPGDFITTYIGQTVPKDKHKDRSYSMKSSVEGVVVNAMERRNLGAFINHHSSHPNAEAHGVFHASLDRLVITAIKPIDIGEQILMNYGDDYFRAPNSKQKNESGSSEGLYVDLLHNFEKKDLPAFLPSPVRLSLQQQWESRGKEEVTHPSNQVEPTDKEQVGPSDNHEQVEPTYNEHLLRLT